MIILGNLSPLETCSEIVLNSPTSAGINHSYEVQKPLEPDRIKPTLTCSLISDNRLCPSRRRLKNSYDTLLTIEPNWFITIKFLSPFEALWPASLTAHYNGGAGSKPFVQRYRTYLETASVYPCPPCESSTSHQS